jgi:tetratricopeptide (TPR) repeat protein
MNRGGGPLDSAVAAVENNDFQAAFDHADEALGAATTDAQREEAFDIMCQSGEQLADTALAEGRFDDVRLISDRVSERSDAVDSVDAATQEILGRLESLRLQARRGMTSEIALSELDSLKDYYANLSSLVPDWLNSGTGVSSAEADEIRQEYENAISEFPTSRELRLNFGQFLLEQHETEEAIEQFRAILEGNEVVGLLADPENRDALVGMAIAAFKDPSSESASETIKQLMELIPNDEAASDILEAIEGNLESRLRNPLLPGGVVPSAETLDMLRETLENLRQNDDPIQPEDESAAPPM